MLKAGLISLLALSGVSDSHAQPRHPISPEVPFIVYEPFMEKPKPIAIDTPITEGNTHFITLYCDQGGAFVNQDQTFLTGDYLEMQDNYPTFVNGFIRINRNLLSPTKAPNVQYTSVKQEGIPIDFVRNLTFEGSVAFFDNGLGSLTLEKVLELSDNGEINFIKDLTMPYDICLDGVSSLEMGNRVKNLTTTQLKAVGRDCLGRLNQNERFLFMNKSGEIYEASVEFDLPQPIPIHSEGYKALLSSHGLAYNANPRSDAGSLGDPISTLTPDLDYAPSATVLQMRFDYIGNINSQPISSR